MDDDPAVARSLRNLPEVLGHEVQLARSGAEALRKAPAFRPDVAFVDIGRPEMDGYEVTRRLREQAGQPPYPRRPERVQRAWRADHFRLRSMPGQARHSGHPPGCDRPLRRRERLLLEIPAW